MRGIELGGREWTLRHTWRSVGEAERKAGMGLAKMLDEHYMGALTTACLLWAGMTHQERGLTLERVQMMMDEYREAGGNLLAIGEAVIESLERGGFMGNSEAGADAPTPAS